MIWFCKWYHDLMFFISLYKIVVSIYTKLSRYIKVYSIMLYQIQKNMNLTKFVWYVDIENWYYEEAYHELITPNSILKYQKQKLESYKVCMAYF